VQASAASVFINCPFDDEFKESFEALIFCITASGYRVRCALEENDAANIRLEKLYRLISESTKSIHDLSRVNLSSAGLPRFNMPFELGLFMGARNFGGRSHQAKSALIMVTEAYVLPKYLSDLGGNDPQPHGGRPEKVIEVARRYLDTRPEGNMLPGAAKILSDYGRFKAKLPDLAAALNFKSHEIDVYRDYRV
jgi:hypothetical protein